jgi:hypothetical protein
VTSSVPVDTVPVVSELVSEVVQAVVVKSHILLKSLGECF